MIRRFLLLLASIAGTWYLADTIKQKGPGYVLVYFDGYSVETGFWVALVLMAALVLLVYATVRLAALFVRYSTSMGLLPEIFSRHRSLRMEKKGIQAFLDQSWSAAGQQMTRAAQRGSSPFLDHLMAARAFLAMGSLQEAEKSMQQARELPDADVDSLSLLALDIAFAKNDISTTNRLLLWLLEKSPKKAAVLSRAINVYSAGQNWHALLPLLPRIKKQHVLDEDAFLQLQANVAAGLMHPLAKPLTMPELQAVLKDFSSVSSRPEVVHSYCSALVAIGETGQADKRIRQYLEGAWDDGLVALFSTLKCVRPEAQLAYAEQFLPQQKGNRLFLLSLARMAIAIGQWGKARDYLQGSLRIKPSAEACKLMAEVSEKLHDAGAASHYLKQGLELAMSGSRS